MRVGRVLPARLLVARVLARTDATLAVGVAMHVPEYARGYFRVQMRTTGVRRTSLLLRQPYTMV